VSGQVIREPHEIDHLALADHQAWRVLSCGCLGHVTRTIPPQTPFRASPSCPECALALGSAIGSMLDPGFPSVSPDSPKPRLLSLSRTRSSTPIWSRIGFLPPNKPFWSGARVPLLHDPSWSSELSRPESDSCLGGSLQPGVRPALIRASRTRLSLEEVPPNRPPESLMQVNRPKGFPIFLFYRRSCVGVVFFRPTSSTRPTSARIK
jgi:hypothetical protein